MSDAARLRSIAQAVAVWLHSTAAAMLGSADGISVDPQVTDGALILVVCVPPAGRGRLVGQHGRSITAIEIIARAIAGRAGASLPVSVKVTAR